MNLTDLKALLTPAQDGTLADIAHIISRLKARQTAIDLSEYKKQFNPAGHNAMDETLRKDKMVTRPTGEKDNKGNDVTEKVKVLVNRLVFPLQKLIVSRAVSFLFGNPVKIKSEAADDGEKKVLAGLIRILYDNKIDSFNRRIARELFRSTQVAECWFPVATAEVHTDYGFEAKFKLRVAAFNLWDGNDLYPLYDETGDLIAFSREFSRQNEEGKSVKYFETYTAEQKLVWSNESGTWEQTDNKPNVIGKIPVIFARQEQVEWQDVQKVIERLEYLLSNFADVNDYHAAPKIFVEGKIMGFGQKGEPGQILQGEKDSKAYYLSWDHAPESVRLEIETLLRFIFSFTQTPDISFDSVKGLREISGEALKMLFLDAHLKVQDKREVFDEYLQRRLNVIKAFIGYMNTGLKKQASSLKVEADVQPFIISNEKDIIDRLTEANGGKPLISKKTAITLSGLVDNPEEEYNQIQKEEKESSTLDVLPTGA